MSALFISIVAFLIISPVLCDPQSAQQQQRNSIGFLGMRGKRSSSEKYTTTLGNSISDESIEQTVTPQDGSTVSLSDYKEYSNQDLMLDPWPMYRQLRAPNGFFGVRGKKEYEDHVNPLRTESFGDMDNQFKGFQEKRVPNGFMGMRGKKYYGFKRAPSGFMGMRGKKNYEEVDGNSIYDEDLESELYQELMDERLLMSHSMDDNQLNELEKRAPSGFMGMRGKKSVRNNDYFESDKRAPMGFQGVRGKKSQFENFLVTENKRGPVTGFFGMRGKKQPNTSSYFGVRKKPYEFRGKFVGVRGKKAPDGSLKSLTLDFNGIQQTGELRPAQLVNSETNPHNKRLGFIGMRGRK